ncbi:hypothetical protein [Actinomadura sp. DC4]|nr:hypothetical protein [Actinomadura sp. DC4]MDN3357620.1 hypothetical protein [Actinomadura sp. DC4]
MELDARLVDRDAERPAHLYFRRAKSSQLLSGDSDHHRDRLVGHL